MDKKTFTEAEIKKLICNPYVESVTSTLITYTDEFKRIFISQDRDGKLPREIFRENGFDVDHLGGSRIRKAAYRWRKAYAEQGIDGLWRDTGTGTSSQHESADLMRDIGTGSLSQHESADPMRKDLEGHGDILVPPLSS